jgi:hypothetical protein
MKTVAERVQHGIGTLGLVIACIYLLGLAAPNHTARVPKSNRDIETSLQPNIHSVPTAAPASKFELTKDEEFTSQTDVREYRLPINTDNGEVHLNVTAEIKRGLL